MKNIILLGLLFGTILSANAQNYSKVSGFLGNRFSIGGGVSLSPSDQTQTVVKAGTTAKNDFSINKMFHGDIQYVIGSYDVLSFTLGKSKTSANVHFEKRNYSDIIGWGAYNSGDYQYQLQYYSGSPKIEDLYYGLHYKRFLLYKGSLAPVGTYVQLGFNIHNYLIDFSQLRMMVSTDVGFGERQNLQHKMEFDIAKKSVVEVMAAVGKSRSISDRMLLDYSMSAGLHGPFYNDGNVTSEDRLNNPAAVKAVKETLRRTRRMHYIKLSISLTGLLF